MADDEWDDALGDKAQPTVSPDVVRKLLEMNPSLRERGMTTNIAMNQMTDAQAQKQFADAQGKKPASTGVAAKPVTRPPAASNTDIVAAFRELKKRLGDGNKRIDDDMQKLKKQREELAVAMRDELTNWILKNDPDMRSPVTQSMLDQEKAFLLQLGFTVKAYVEQRTRNTK
jgi:hypothetical protein